MRRRTLIGAAGLLFLPGAAWAQTTATRATPAPEAPPITPENPLETAFVAAFTRESARPEFRRLLLSSNLALALANATPESPPLFVEMSPSVTGQSAVFRGGAVFTSLARLQAALGPTAPNAVMKGRDALERLRGRNMVLNYHLVPVLTLEADDVAHYLDQPEGR